MKQLKKGFGRVEIKGLGISLDKNSTQQQIENAIKRVPRLAAKFEEVEELKIKNDGKKTAK